MNRFVIFSPGYNTPILMKKCMESVQYQNYPNYIHMIIDDASTINLINVYNELQPKNISFHRNNENLGKGLNAYTYLRNLDDEDIIVELDLDDYLIDRNVLTILNDVYNDPDVWITYSKYIRKSNYFDVGQPYPPEIIYSRLFRNYPWLYSHLRTYKYKLFKNINEEDFKYNGKWIKLTCDQMLAFPMLEMAGHKHIKFIDQCQLIYNDVSEYNDDKRFSAYEQELWSQIIRKKRKYDLL